MLAMREEAEAHTSVHPLQGDHVPCAGGEAMSCSETDLYDGPGCWKLDLILLGVPALIILLWVLVCWLFL